MNLANLDDRPEGWFPASDEAQENGLLCYGGELTTTRLLAAYVRGIFPCPLPRMPMLWWTTNPRMALAPGRIRCGKTLHKELRRHPWRVTSDHCFPKVIHACASKREKGSWITGEIAEAYGRMHQFGYVHSVEVWLHDKLVGGLYGMALGRVFFGESVFSTRPNAGKVALLACAGLLEALGYVLIDCQMQSPLLASMGARNLSRRAFERILARHVHETPGPWKAELINLPQLEKRTDNRKQERKTHVAQP